MSGLMAVHMMVNGKMTKWTVWVNLSIPTEDGTKDNTKQIRKKEREATIGPMVEFSKEFGLMATRVALAIFLRME